LPSRHRARGILPRRRLPFRREISVVRFSDDISRDREFKVFLDNNNYEFRLEGARQLKRLNKLLV